MTAWRGVRFREDVGWEMRCESCSGHKVARYWPLTHEFWDPNKGLTRCRACWNAYQRKWSRRARASAAMRLYQREWAARKRAQARVDEGREKYQRRAA